MSIQEDLQKWWERRSEEQRDHLKQAAEKQKLDGETVALLINTGCPVGPAGTQWDTQPELDWHWSNAVRSFIKQQ